jgi:hypothetical protein
MAFLEAATSDSSIPVGDEGSQIKADGGVDSSNTDKCEMCGKLEQWAEKQANPNTRSRGSLDCMSVPYWGASQKGRVRWHPLKGKDGRESGGFLIIVGDEGATQGMKFMMVSRENVVSAVADTLQHDSASGQYVYCWRMPKEMMEMKACHHFTDIAEALNLEIWQRDIAKMRQQRENRMRLIKEVYSDSGRGSDSHDDSDDDSYE